MPATSTDHLRANLDALARRQPDVARQIEEASPASIEWVQTGQGLSGRFAGRALASTRTPLDEARTWADAIDLVEHGVVVIIGFGLGWHVAEIVRRQKAAEPEIGSTRGQPDAVLVFEPDVSLLRTVMEQIDLTGLLASSLYLVTSAKDAATPAAVLGAHNRPTSVGVHIGEHVPSLPRISAEQRRDFLQTLNAAVAATRVGMSSELIQVEGTFRNVLNNVDYYVASRPLLAWRSALAGRPAVVVAAGPSLQRTIDALARPGVREQVLIVAVQTALKPLLARGIKPHIVCALDHHEISRRFYEGLTADDVRGVTLVYEAKVNPAVSMAWPGERRATSDGILEAMLGPELVQSMGAVRQGSTVAHLAYYIARDLGCDPVALTGLDLGFTDGTYYSSGAVIHQAWAGELGEFNTLEMLEWQRIKRMGTHLREATDTLGRAMYTDEQMNTYLQHFHTDFLADVQRGLKIIDATEGGVAKQHTTTRPLGPLLEEFITAGRVAAHTPIDDALAEADRRHAQARNSKPVASYPLNATVAARLRTRINTVREGLQRIRRSIKTSTEILPQVREHLADRQRADALIMRLDRIRQEVITIEPAWSLLMAYNALGSFKSWKADRRLRYTRQGLKQIEIQQRQLERDETNLTWLCESLDRLTGQIDGTVEMLAGGKRRTSDIASLEAIEATEPPKMARCVAIVPVMTSRSGLGLPRDLAKLTIGGQSVVQLTVSRLLRIEGCHGVTLVTHQPELVTGLLGTLATDSRVRLRVVEREPAPWEPSVTQAGRAWMRSAWRGGLGNATVYDEVFDPQTILDALEAEPDASIDGVIVCGADWCCIDPALASQQVVRLGEQLRESVAPRAIFTVAGPGLTPLLMSRAALKFLSVARRASGVWGGVSGLTGYVPMLPVVDPIASRSCVAVPGPVRDALLRTVADSPAQCAMLSSLMSAAGLDPTAATGEQIARALDAHADRLGAPTHARINVGTEASGRWLSVAQVHAVLQRLRADSVLTLEGDVLQHPAITDIFAAISQRGVPMHLRIGPLTADSYVQTLLSSGATIISVDFGALRPEAFATRFPALVARHGPGLMAASHRRIEQLVNAAPRDDKSGTRRPWIIARITRCDATYQDIDAFYDNNLHALSWAVIDPLPQEIPGQRIGPLALPTLAQRRRAAEEWTIGPDDLEVAS
jgi:hypothetical protein